MSILAERPTGKPALELRTSNQVASLEAATGH